MSLVAAASAISASPHGFGSVLGVLIFAAFVALVLIAQRDLSRRLLAGSGERIRTLIYARRLDSDLFTIVQTISGHTLHFAGLLYDSPWELPTNDQLPCHFAGTWQDLGRVSKQTGASHLLVVGWDGTSRDAERISDRCERLNLQCSVLLDPRNPANARHACTYLHGLPVHHEPMVEARAQFLYLKRAIDLIVGSCLLIVALPVGALVAAVIKWDSPGPIFFLQQRIGKDGRPFKLLKFRSMYTGSPKYHRSPTSDSDPRITRAGKLLRRLSLDELPQLINVLKGDMSLVGPRPEMPFIVGQYGEAARRRLLLRPGITGLWQISRARSLPIHHNLQYDLFYIERQSLFLDAAILLRTFGAVIRGIGAA